MPRLPDVNSFGERPSVRGGGGVARYSVPGPSQEGAALARVGEAVSGVGEKFGRVYEAEQAQLDKLVKVEQARLDDLRVEDAINRTKRAAQELELGEKGFSRRLGGNVVGKPIVEEFNRRFDDQVGLIEQSLDERQRDLFRLRSAPLRGQYSGRLLAHIETETGRFAAETAKNTVDVESSEAMANWQNPQAFAASMARITYAIDQEADRAGWAPETVKATKAKVTSAIHLGVIDRLIANRQDDEAAAYYAKVRKGIAPDMAGKVEGALAKAKERHEAEQAAETKRSNEAAASDLEISIRRGEASYGDIERLYSQGVITPAKRTELTVSLDREAQKATEKATKDREAMERVRSALDGRSFLDFRKDADRDSVDVYFERVVMPGIAEGTEAAKAMDVIADFSAQTGIVPNVIRGQIRGALRSGDFEDRAQAADLLDRLKTANPAVVDDFSPADVALGNHIAIYVRAGMAPERAVALATEAQNVAPAEREARETRYRTDKAPDANFGKLQKELTGFRMFGDSMPAKLPDALAGEYEALTRAEFIRSGDLEVAQKTALDHVRRVWGVTRVDDKPRWMKYAPEIVYKVPGHEDGKWIREQLLREVKSGALIAEDAQITLAADSLTARERLPSYVILVGREGVLEPIIGKDGRPMRFRPEFKRQRNSE